MRSGKKSEVDRKSLCYQFVEDSSNVCRRYHAVSTRLAKKGRKSRKRRELISALS
jgi:hypothetical protein